MGEQCRKELRFKNRIRAAGASFYRYKQELDIKIVLLTTQTPLVQHGDHADAELLLLAPGHFQRNMKE